MSRERDERMWALARKFAQSGKYNGWLDIEHELRLQGFPRARQLLDDDVARENLDRICAEARKDKTGA